MNAKERERIVREAATRGEWPCHLCGETVRHGYDCACECAKPECRYTPTWLRAMLHYSLSTALPAGTVAVNVDRLAQLEWAGETTYMDGTRWDCCPACQETREYQAHLPDCWLAAAIKDGEQ